MKLKNRLLFPLILFCFVLGLSVQAFALPAQPHNLYGYASDEGGVKITGATVTATLNDDTELARIQDNNTFVVGTSAASLDTAGMEGYYDFNFMMDDPDTAADEGASAGDVIHIYINGVESNETRDGSVTIVIGASDQLDITVPDELGPIASNIKTDASTSLSIPEGNTSVTLTASITDIGKGGNNIKAAEYFTGTAGDNGTGTAMAASDGTFNAATEDVTATVNTSSWVADNSPYTLLVHGQDSKDNWGATASVQVTVYKAPDAPTLTNIAARTNDQTPTFDWNDVTNAATYTIEVSIQNDFATTVIQDATLTTSTYTPGTNLAEGTYYWRVRATDADSHAGPWATGTSFVVDITPPAVAIDAVTTPTAVTTQTITGTMEAGATITAAADTAAAPGTATFPTTTTYSIEVTGLVKDANVITVTATDQAGNTATAQATIAYHPPITVAPSGDVYVPVTVPGYTQDFSITGGSGTFTWALDTETYGTLTSAAGTTNTFTPVADTPGNAVLTITDTVYTEKAAITVNIHAVEFGMTPTTGQIAVGGTINISVVGAVGTVEWVVNTAAVGSIGSLTGDHSENGVFTGSAAGITTITVTDGGTGGTGASMTSGNFEVVNPIVVTPASTVIDDSKTLQINITGGKGTQNSDYTLTLNPAGAGTITADGLFTPAAGDGVRKFTVTAADKTYTSITGQSAEIAVVDPLVITGKPTGNAMQTASTNTFTFTGGSGAVTWTASEGTITEAGLYTAPTVDTGSVNVVITATDQAYNTITATANVQVYGLLAITMPEGYDADDSTTWPLLKTATYTVVAGGGNPAETVAYAINDSTDTAVAGGIDAATGVIDVNALLAKGAGVYTVVASKTGSTPVQMKVRVPMRLAPMSGSFKDNQANQAFTVTGVAGGLAWSVTDEKGDVIEMPSFGNFTDPAVTGPTATFDFTDGITETASFKIMAESSTQALIDAGIDTVITEILYVFPVDDLDIQVNNAADDAGIAGAVIKAKHDQTITAITDADGAATIADMKNTGVTYEFSVTAAGYLPGTFTAFDFADGVTIELEAITAEGSISGTVTPAGSGIIVQAKNAAGEFVGDSADNAITVYADSTTGAYNFIFDTATAGDGPYTVIVTRHGYVDVTDNGGQVTGKIAGDTNANVAMAPATKITITDDGGATNLVFSVAAVPAFANVINDEIQLSVGTTAQTTPLDGSGLTFTAGKYTHSVAAPATGATASIYVQADTSTTARDASAGYYATKVYTVVGGVTTSAPVSTDITDPNIGGTASSTNGSANVPAGGVDTMEGVTLSISESSKVATTAGSIVIFNVDLVYTATGEKVDNSLINRVYVTISFDPSKVTSGSLESGDIPILQADDIAGMAAGTATEVPPAQIVSTDYTAGKVTFWVDHLSVFGIGAAEVIPPPVTPTVEDEDWCFIATAAYGSKFEPHVQTLRDFRDTYLLSNRLGTGFVKMYYRYSPPIAKVIANHEGLRFATRLALTPFIGMSYAMLHTNPAEKVLIFIMLIGLGAGMYRMRRRSVLVNN